MRLPQNVRPCKYQPNNFGKELGDKNEKFVLTDDKAKGKDLVQCIEGRRPKTPFAVSALGAAAAAALTLTGDDGAGTVVGLTLVNEASSKEGLANFLSGRDADIGNTLIFEVEIADEKYRTGFIIEPPKPK